MNEEWDQPKDKTRQRNIEKKIREKKKILSSFPCRETQQTMICVFISWTINGKPIILVIVEAAGPN